MLNLTGSTLCIVASPFQCLCMFEALHHFNITDYDVLVGYCDELSLDKIDSLFKKKGIPYIKLKTAHVIKDLLFVGRRIKKRYTNFIIADFDNRNGYSIACLLAKRSATVCFIDDGAQAYQFFSVPPVRKTFKKKVKAVYTIYELLGSIKHIIRPIYYTVYDVSSDDYHIIRNDMFLMRSGLKGIMNGIYIIGTNSSVLEFRDKSYKEYLAALLKYIRNSFGETPVFYCPHRRDLNNEQVLDYCRLNNIFVFDTQISVEYDFVEKRINPKAIIGFNSNALYTLHILFPESICQTVRFHLVDQERDKRNSDLTNKLQEKGISVVELK